MIRIATSNTKLGKIPSFSFTPGVFTDANGDTQTPCPGASAWCAAKCYAKKFTARYSNVKTAYDANFDATLTPHYFEAAMTDWLAKHAPTVFRIHVSGDFHNAAYAMAWAQIVQRFPKIHFYAYTRSWNTTQTDLLGTLNLLRRMPNMQLFASWDNTMPPPPARWRKAVIADGLNDTRVVCMEQTGAKPNCAACGYCFRGVQGDITFKIH